MTDESRNSAQDASFEEEPIRLPSLPRRHPMVERMMAEAIEEEVVARYRRRAQFTFLCGAEPEEIGGHDGQLEVVGRCLEWFVFDCLIPDLELTPAEIWFDRHGARFDEEDLEAAENYLDFTLGIFEVGDVLTGKGFTAIDLLRDEQVYPVYEEVISEEIEPGQLLLGRIFPMEEHFVLSGMAVVMSRQAAEDIRLLIRHGKLLPDHVLSKLDGLELENLFGRSLTELEQASGAATAERRLRRYFGEVNRESLDYEGFAEIVRQCRAVEEVAAALDGTMTFFNHHERELIFALAHVIWKNVERGA